MFLCMMINRIRRNTPLYTNVVGKIVVINIVCFVLFFLLSGFFSEYLVLHSASVWSKPWTLLTTTFLHKDVSHIFFNMYALFLFGPMIERRIGSARFLGFYLLSGILASLGYVFFEPAGSAVGASGAIMGILGLVIVLLPNLQVLFFFVVPMTMRTAGIIFALIDVIGLFNPSNGVANIAHLVGLACGLIYGNYLLKQKKVFYDKFTGRFAPSSEKTNVYSSAKGSRVRVNKDPNKVIIELSDDDISDYLKNGRI